MSENDTSRIVIDNSTVMLQIVASLTDDSSCTIDDHKKYFVQATGIYTIGEHLKGAPLGYAPASLGQTLQLIFQQGIFL
jgi:hypothetical protein